jgi:hypothetical protein
MLLNDLPNGIKILFVQNGRPPQSIRIQYSTSS